jgi:hypothetical protein
MLPPLGTLTTRVRGWSATTTGRGNAIAVRHRGLLSVCVWPVWVWVCVVVSVRMCVCVCVGVDVWVCSV